MNVKAQDGFISVVALGMFAIIIIFVLISQSTIMQSMEDIKNSKNYLAARDLGDSALEYLQYKVNKEMENVPFNYDVECEYIRGTDEGKPEENMDNVPPLEFAKGSNKELCGEVHNRLAALRYDKQMKNVKITMKVKGHADESDKMENTNCKVSAFNPGGLANNCYIIPFCYVLNEKYG